MSATHCLPLPLSHFLCSNITTKSTWTSHLQCYLLCPETYTKLIKIQQQLNGRFISCFIFDIYSCHMCNYIQWCLWQLNEILGKNWIMEPDSLYDPTWCVHNKKSKNAPIICHTTDFHDICNLKVLLEFASTLQFLLKALFRWKPTFISVHISFTSERETETKKLRSKRQIK
jgi:hypothetical protein